MIKKYVFPYATEEGKCHDCGVWPGQLHREGCDVEACPFSFGQKITCTSTDCEKVKKKDKVPFGFESKEVREIAKKPKTNKV